MKKNRLKGLLLMCAIAQASMMQATVLRVNNEDPSAPYSSINDAVAAAVAGDTIMVEGSNTSYGDATLDKKLTIIGPGYWLRENNIATEAAAEAQLNSLTTTAEGTTITGLCVMEGINVKASKTIITRCFVSTSLYTCIFIDEGVTNCIIHQNYLTSAIGADRENSSYHQITNNLWNVDLKRVHDSYVAYNTSISAWGESVWASSNNKIEKNIVGNNVFGNDDKGNTYNDNFFYVHPDVKTDKDFRDAQLPEGAEGHGAFAGDDPYVISGIPAGPMIEELTVPTSVEEGQTLSVTIKLGSAK